jgi:hypothetical protein
MGMRSARPSRPTRIKGSLISPISEPGKNGKYP